MLTAFILLEIVIILCNAVLEDLQCTGEAALLPDLLNPELNANV